MTNLTGKRIVLGLSGGVACYKSAELVRGLVGLGARVNVVMTESATRFITPVTLKRCLVTLSIQICGMLGLITIWHILI